jgi:parvulin-like peptidyl-prolyl isomerase
VTDELHVRRAMLLYAGGALIGLGIAGYGLFTAAGTTTHTVPPEDIALVNQRPILRSDFINQLESETGLKFGETTAAQQLQVLDEMVREELLVQRGLELDFAETDQTTRNALVSTVTQQVTVDVTTSQPSDEQLEEYYRRHTDKYASEGTIEVRNLVLSGGAPSERSLDAARQAAAALRAGEPFERVMGRFGMTEAKRYDEDYYFAAKYRLGDALFAAVKDLAAGQVSEPMALADGIHVVQVVKNGKPLPLGYEASRPQVFSDYRSDAQAHLVESTMAFLRARSKILIAKDYAGRYKP